MCKNDQFLWLTNFEDIDMLYANYAILNYVCNLVTSMRNVKVYLLVIMLLVNIYKYVNRMLHVMPIKALIW